MTRRQYALAAEIAGMAVVALAISYYLGSLGETAALAILYTAARFTGAKKRKFFCERCGRQFVLERKLCSECGGTVCEGTP